MNQVNQSFNRVARPVSPLPVLVERVPPAYRRPAGRQAAEQATVRAAVRWERTTHRALQFGQPAVITREGLLILLAQHQRLLLSAEQSQERGFAHVVVGPGRVDGILRCRQELGR